MRAGLQTINDSQTDCYKQLGKKTAVRGKRDEERQGYGRTCLIFFIQTNSSMIECRLERTTWYTKENAKHAISKKNPKAEKQIHSVTSS